MNQFVEVKTTRTRNEMWCRLWYSEPVRAWRRGRGNTVEIQEAASGEAVGDIFFSLKGRMKLSIYEIAF